MLDADLDASSPVEYSSTPDLSYRFKSWLKVFGKKCVEEEDNYAETPEQSSSPSLDEILDEDVRETLEELEKKIDRLRLLGIPLDVIVEFVARYETISRLRITDDLRIFLPDYNDIEVKMPALYKAVYLLFIYHRKEGIVLQQLEKYHSDLVMFYRKTKNTEQLTPRQLESINKLESSWNDDGSIYVVLSRIKKLFINAIDEHLAKHYYIEGRPGQPYNIALSHDLIIWGDEDE
jgi:DNA repair exonuclease SbcCD ATPase subunit